MIRLTVSLNDWSNPLPSISFLMTLSAQNATCSSPTRNTRSTFFMFIFSCKHIDLMYSWKLKEFIVLPSQNTDSRNISRISAVWIVQIERYLRKKNCNFISRQHVWREQGSTSRKLLFSLIHLLVEENKCYFRLSEAN